MVRLNQFSLQITPGTETEDQYHALGHGTSYAILVANQSEFFCDATLEIDGGVIARRRLKPHETITIKRPDAVDKEFIFYAANSAEGMSVGMDSRDENLGLIKVTLHTGDLLLQRHPVFQPQQSRGSSKSASFGAGGTALGGASGQNLAEAPELAYHKHPPTVLMVRLVELKNNPGIVPIQSAFLSTPTPPPIGSRGY